MPQPAYPIRVVVADDDAQFRAAARAVLDADPRFVVVAETDTGLALGDLAARVSAHLVVVDVRMPHGGPAAVAAIRRRTPWAARPGTVVCALSAQTSTPWVSAMVAAGATGFLAKGAVGADLPDLLARCAAGQVVLAVPSGAAALGQLLAAGPLPATAE